MKKLLAFFSLIIPFTSFSQSSSISTIPLGASSRLSFEGDLQSILIGQGAGNINSTGQFNTYIGSLNGSNNTDGKRNVAIGSNAGMNNTSGSYNINLGVIAGLQNLEGLGNINIGDGAGYSDLYGDYNVRIGYLAGAFASGDGNVFLGPEAGYSYQGDNQLIIANSHAKPGLIHGDFDKDSLAINGDLYVTGNIEGSIKLSQIIGLLGNGYSAVFPEALDNTVTIEIAGVLNTTNVLITNSVGFEIDTFTVFGGSCLEPNTGLTAEFPLTFETANASDISDLQSWFSSPDNRSLSIIIKDVSGTETFRYNMFDYYPSSTSAGTDGRTSFTLIHNMPPNNSSGIDIDENFGSSFSYNPGTDKLIEIEGVTHSNFTPAVQVDYTKRVITLEMTYNEGAGLVNWINGFVNGSDLSKRSMSIIETTDGTGSTETSRENFFEVVPFKYELIYGFGLNTKLKARMLLQYGCNEPG